MGVGRQACSLETARRSTLRRQAQTPHTFSARASPRGSHGVATTSQCAQPRCTLRKCRQHSWQRRATMVLGARWRTANSRHAWRRPNLHQVNEPLRRSGFIIQAACAIGCRSASRMARHAQSEPAALYIPIPLLLQMRLSPRPSLPTSDSKLPYISTSPSSTSMPLSLLRSPPR